MKPYSEVIDYIRQLATEYPNQTSKDSYFNHESGVPVCIFGHALAHFGGRPSGFSVLNPDGDILVQGYESAVGIDWPRLDIETPSLAEKLWSDEVQSKQDSGASWGEAVFWADEKSPL